MMQRTAGLYCNFPGVYKIQSIVKPERVYIGSAININERWRFHLRDLNKNKHHSKKLQRHYNKYDKNDLIFSILRVCEKEDLIKIEQYFIDTLKPYFNTCLKAGSPLGFKHSKKTIELLRKLSTGNKNCLGRKASDETRKKLSEQRAGKKRNPLSEETKRKIGEKSAGRIFSEESKKKMSKSHLGQKNNIGHHHSEETKKKISEHRKGISAWNKNLKNIYSEETRRDMGNGRRGKIPWHKGTKGISHGWHKGVPRSESTKRKISEANKKYWVDKKDLINQQKIA